MLYQVAEIFTSVNGEGLRAGKLAMFIRLAGCPLNCHYCDTMWARENHVGTAMSKVNILEIVKKSGVHYLTLTGGEPLLQPKIDKLIEALLLIEGLNVEVETSGAVDLTAFEGLRQKYDNLFWTVDYKLSGSGMSSQMKSVNYQSLRLGDAVKYVISDSNELDQVEAHIASWQSQSKEAEILLSPAYGQIELETLVKWLKLSVDTPYQSRMRLQLQLHKYIWNPEQRGV